MAHLKRIIVEVKAEDNCLDHALIIAIAKVDNIQIIHPIVMVERYFP